MHKFAYRRRELFADLLRLAAPTQAVLAPFQGWDYVLLSLERLLSDSDLARLRRQAAIRFGARTAERLWICSAAPSPTSGWNA